MAADYDGDAKADVAAFRLSVGTWYLRVTTTVGYGYDPRGNRSARTPLAGLGTTYGYEQANRLPSVPGSRGRRATPCPPTIEGR